MASCGQEPPSPPLADQQALERVAALLQKPVSELYEENLHNSSLGTRAGLGPKRRGEVSRNEVPTLKE